MLRGLGASDDTTSELLKAPDYRSVKAAFQQKKPLSPSELITTVRDILDRAEASPPATQKTIVADIDAALAKTRLGYEAKQHGIEALKGQAHTACSRVLSRLAEFGLFIVPHGELEGWWRAGSAEKARWIVDWWAMRDEEMTFGAVRTWVSGVVARVRQRQQPASVEQAPPPPPPT